MQHHVKNGFLNNKRAIQLKLLINKHVSNFFLNMNFYQTKREGFDNLNDTFGLHMILKVPDTNAFKTAQFHILYKYVWLSVTQKTPGVIDL